MTRKAVVRPTKKDIKEELVKKLAVYDSAGHKTADIDSPFLGPVNHTVLTEAINMYLANLRKGLAQTKTRGEVSGGGKKPWKQKGTGRARAGSIRSPLWRHGGVVFGPHPRDFRYVLAPKVRKAALKAALNEKYMEDNILVLDSLSFDSAKAKELKKLLANLGAGAKVLFVLDKIPGNLALASRNMRWVTLEEARLINALDILRSKKVILLKAALAVIMERIK